MKKVRSYFVTDFTIFAALVLLEALLHQIGFVEDFNSAIVIQYFIVSSLLSATETAIRIIFHKYPIYI